MKPDVSLEFAHLFELPTSELGKIGGRVITDDEATKSLLASEDFLTRCAGVVAVPSFGKDAVRAKAQKEFEESGERLEKIANGERRKLALREWISEELAKGQTVEGLATYAEPRNSEVAQIIREVGAEIEAGIE